jgi:hypothetical protein
MYGNEWKKWVSGTGRVLFACVLLFGQSAWAGQDQKAQDKSAATPKPAAQQTGERQSSAAASAKMQNHEVEGEASENARIEEKSSGDGSHEGIKVHGHWTIEVRNPDGSLVTHREFENSLVPSAWLAGIFSRAYSIGYWEVSLLSGLPGAVGGICVQPGVSVTQCFITEAGQGIAPSQYTFNTLVVSTSGTSLVLSGTAIAQLTGSVGLVQTLLTLCSPPTSSPCPYSSPYGVPLITQATLSSPIQVSAGQTVQVAVNISFS